MANVVVVGAQWGDEGKGKIVDWLSERADVIARLVAAHFLEVDAPTTEVGFVGAGESAESAVAAREFELSSREAQ